MAPRVSPGPARPSAQSLTRGRKGLSSYQQGGGDGEGTGSDARDEVQQVFGRNGTRGVREIPEGLQSQGRVRPGTPQKAACLLLRASEPVPHCCATLPSTEGTTPGTPEHQPPCPTALPSPPGCSTGPRRTWSRS